MNTNNKNNVDFLQGETTKKTGFTTPTGYFEVFSDAVLSKVTTENLPKSTGFKVPENYFEKLETNIQAKKEVSKIRFLTPKRWQFSSIAVAVSVAILLFLNGHFSITNFEQKFNQISDNQIDNWIENNISLIDQTDISYTLDPLNFEDSETISNEEIENYLTYQNTTLQLLENDY